MEKETVLVGKGGEILRESRNRWEEENLAGASDGIASELSFLTEEHRRLRKFVVREIPVVGTPLSSALISERLEMPEKRVAEILEELERNLSFLFRNEQGEVTWAYPVTLDETPHRAAMTTGETVYAA